ncbi:hypothetical protein SPRG_04224 [Saprolegnia parasitica CBS 223.65]|uniref:N-acetyltransferase domain-containing protein n=1 Tax=Saprolegnia parasitica (strain CBS 223.65) TaxID=695850 RepID=A0A067CW54_SAPPC|nr:hypothetical protein SPRG_04224 [Saprolegnia parasitica CBS 223.65]KDO31037.1 hypothetical protein SPRG_04224 [Saprolegnia parasitica CBS 223.65]|eukprot:XP_012198214.1 hypothetical protein SPRG_04224 [Saprolegnia parasitica CBS 223.65]
MQAALRAMARRVQHIPDKHQFTCEAQSSTSHMSTLLGFLEYRIQGDVMDIRRTYVLPDGRGNGVAKALCDEAFRFAAARSLSVQPSCAYIATRYAKQQQRLQHVQH